MPLVPIIAAPGICKSLSDYGAAKNTQLSGRYTDGNHIRFVAGSAEKIGGWVSISGITGLIGIPRAAKSWRDQNAMPRLAIGTETHLYAWDGATLSDITPLRTIASGTLGNNPFTTTSSSSLVTVADASATLVNGDWVSYSGAATFNNVTVNGWYPVQNVNPGVGYQITVATVASGSGAGGGASVVFSYPRELLGNNPFTTTSGSNVVTVTDSNHGALTNDYVTFAGAATFNGVTLNGQYPLTVVNANSYTVIAATTASGTGSGGGAAVQVTHNISMSVLSLTNPVAYGVGVYGTGPYGYSQGTVATGSAGWSLDRYGSQILASPIGGTIYVYDPAKGGTAYPLLNAPNNILAMFVTPERFVTALGTLSSRMQMAWADQNDYTNWTTLPTNTANSGRTLQGGTQFVAGLPVRGGVSLLFSDKAVFSMNYSGDNFVYATPEASDNASILSLHAVAVLGEAAYWMGNGDFWTWNGAVQPLPSDDIREYVYRDLNPLYVSKTWVMAIRSKKEIWFNYVSAGSSEIDSYVIYHIDQQCWSIGKWSGLLGSGLRTAGIDADLFFNPICLDVNGLAYQHEVGTDDAAQPLDANVTFSPIDASNGNQNLDVFGFLPDFSRLIGNISLTVNVRQYPQDPNSVSGPFILTPNDTNPYQDIRADGKMVGFEIDSNVLGGDFNCGVHRLNIQPSGARI